MRFTQNRELSWLNFNKRVLQMGQDPSTPLFERLKFVAIFQSNLSEFFMIRVGGLTDLASLKKEVIDNKSHMNASQQLEAIYREVAPLEELRDLVFCDVESQLWSHGVRRHSWEGLVSEQRKFLDEYAGRYILSILSPQIIDPRHPFPHLQNGELYVAVRLSIPEEEAEDDDPEVLPAKAKDKAAKDGNGKGKDAKGKGKGRDKAGKAGSQKMGPKVQKTKSEPLVGIIPVPSIVPRAIELPGDGIDFILTEEVIAHYAPQVFDMYDVSDTCIISVTRNADINPDDETYDDDSDYRQHMKKILKKRKRLAPVRLMAQRWLSDELRKYFCKHLGLESSQVFEIDSPIDLSYVYDLEDKLGEGQAAELLYKPFVPVYPPSVERGRSMFDQLRERDILLSYPFDAIDPFLELLKEAAKDPDVVSVKITLYRMARYSKVAEALIEAAENGKDVVVLLELRARFDEEANIGWAERLEEAGCTVLYGFEGYKVHSKICQITRKRDNGIEFFTQLGTGNYNEKTARQYTDLCLMTADGDIGFDGVTFFNNMALGNLDGQYKDLWVSPSSLKDSLAAAIDAEIEKAQAGKHARIVMKCNSVTDLDLIEKLAEASRAGVHVDMVVRGICCLVPGVEGETDNITVTSIVGRFLEHSRVYCFGEGDDERIYLGSADIMTRNTERRVEILAPVKDPALRQRIRDMFGVMLGDTARARKLQPDGGYAVLEAPDGSDPIDSQAYFMQEAIQRAVASVAEKTVTKEMPTEVVPEQVETAPAGVFARLGRWFRRLFGRGDKGEEKAPAALIAQPAAPEAQAPEPTPSAEPEPAAPEPEPEIVDEATPDDAPLEEVHSEIVE